MSDNCNSNHHHSVIYNNAGIRLMALGNYAAALELFRGALASKLTQERIMLHSNSTSIGGHVDDNMNDDDDDDDNEDNDSQQRCVSPDGSDDSSSNNTPLQSHTQGNENLDSYLDLLRNMDEQQRRNDEARLSSTTPTSFAPSGFNTSSVAPPLHSSLEDGISTVVLRSFRGYEPYLYQTPFVLPGYDVASESQSQSSIQLAQSVSCRIVFNLGLIHQTVCRSSCKVASFYEIAATLLSSLPTEFGESSELTAMVTLLRIAILNNFGVWCYENGEGESMMNSFEQLVDTLEEDQDQIDPTILRGVRANIQAFLTPHDGVSLAA